MISIAGSEKERGSMGSHSGLGGGNRVGERRYLMKASPLDVIQPSWAL